jgi:hypothetical protein
MKTISLHRIITIAGVLAILLITSFQSRSQQLITFTNGSVLKVFITYQTRDTVKYYTPENPNVIYGETMDHILKIETLDLSKQSKPATHAILTPDEKEYWKYKRGITTGGVFMGTGAILGIAGVLGWSSTNDADNANETLGAVFSVMGMVVGSGLFIAGGIVLAVNSVNMSVYKREHGLSVNIKCTPQVSGVSLVYKF